MTATVADALSRETRIREAWEMVERALPGDYLSVGVALDYVMDAVGCERGGAKSLLYRWAATLCGDKGDDPYVQGVHPSVYVAQFLFEGRIDAVGRYPDLYANLTNEHPKWLARVRPVIALCVLIEG